MRNCSHTTKESLSKNDPTHIKHDHQYYMKQAITLALQNPVYPFGCVIVNTETGEIVGKGVNDAAKNPTFHGEMQAINDYVSNHGNKDWEKLILYTTGEPCSMCMSAIAWAAIPKVVWGSSIETIRSSGIGQIDLSAQAVALAAKEVYQPKELISGVLSEETDYIFYHRKKN